MRTPAQNVHRFAARQGGHVTRAQLYESGLAPRTVADWIRRGQLIRVYRGVYAVGHLQRNPINAAHAALLAGGARCALAGECAMVLWGPWKRWPKRFEIVTAADRRPSGLWVHHSRTLLRRRDIRVVQGLRVTSPARTALDMAPRLRDDQLARAIEDMRLSGVLSRDELRDVAARNPRHPGATPLELHLEYAQEEPTRSWLEDIFLPLLRRHRLPTPQINVYVGGHRVDAYFPNHQLVAQLDGFNTHGRTKYAFVNDRHIDAEVLARTGIPTIRIPYDDVTGEAIARLTDVLRARSPEARGSSA